MQYVVLHHTGIAHPHYDLMLDLDGVSMLQTYQLTDWPIATNMHYSIRRIGDHRRLYLDYEGPISGDRGSVKSVARGNFLFVEKTIILLDNHIRIQLPVIDQSIQSDSQ